MAREFRVLSLFQGLRSLQAREATAWAMLIAVSMVVSILACALLCIVCRSRRVTSAAADAFTWLLTSHAQPLPTQAAGHPWLKFVILLPLAQVSITSAIICFLVPRLTGNLPNLIEVVMVQVLSSDLAAMAIMTAVVCGLCYLVSAHFRHGSFNKWDPNIDHKML